MTEEVKKLLLKDLCARLPYGVKCNVWYGPKSPALNEKDKYTDDILETINPQKGNCTFHNVIGYDFGFFPIEHVKPYLRPMSSMTEEERKEYMNKNVLDNCDEMNNVQKHYKELRNCPKNQVDEYYHQYIQLPRVYAEDYLNSIHVDYRGLIPKGLALEALDGMYNFK